ncbi:MAG: RNA-binding protein [Nitrospirae bacterium]|nr:RNA-binding protein [Nitrospirota bacterium]
MGTKLFVGNLSYQASENDITELFSQAGTVESVKIITDAQTGQPRGFGFVEMSTPDEAKNAITMFNGTALKERNLTVNEAKPPVKRDSGGGRRPSGGRPMGGGGGRGGDRDRGRGDRGRGGRGR